jgi:putative NADH-flavin reductase
MQTHTIIIFGAGGRTGREVVIRALQAGHTVSAFVFKKPSPGTFPEHPNLHIIEGNARNAAEVQAALTSHDTVINIIAPKLGEKSNYDISSVATKNIIAGMEELGMSRYIGQAGAWATEYIEDASIPMRIAFSLAWPLRQIYTFKKLEDKIVKNSSTNWTLVRCARLTNGKPGRIKIHMDRYKCKMFEVPHISRKSVAQFHLAIIDEPSYIKRAPIISN